MKIPSDFTTAETALYWSLRQCGDNHSAAVDTVIGERLMARFIRK